MTRTGTSKSDIGKRAIVCGYSDRGTVTDVTGRTVTLEMPHGKVSVDQDKVVIMPDPGIT